MMSQTFHWSETRIAAYLQAEGDQISPTQVKVHLKEGCRSLEKLLPEDIRTIYLGGHSSHQQESADKVEAGDLDDSLEELEFF